MNQEGRPIKVHGNRLNQPNLPTYHQRSTKIRRRTYLPTDDSREMADLPDDEQPQGSSNYRDETPTCSTSSSTLNRGLPPPPDSGCKPRSTNRTRAGAQPYAVTNKNHVNDEQSCSTDGYRDEAQRC